MKGKVMAVTLVLVLALQRDASSQTLMRTQQEMSSRMTGLAEEVSRKTDALLEEAGVVALDTPSQLLGDMPQMQDRADMADGRTLVRRLIDWCRSFYARVTAWAEENAPRLVNAWRRG